MKRWIIAGVAGPSPAGFREDPYCIDLVNPEIEIAGLWTSIAGSYNAAAMVLMFLPLQVIFFT